MVYICRWKIKEKEKTKAGLTVRTSIGLQPESDPTIRIPVQGEEADVASDHWMLELVLHHTVCVTVTWESLGGENTLAEGHLLFLAFHPPVHLSIISL